MKNFSVSVVILATDENYTLTETVDYIENKCEQKTDKVIIVLSRKATSDCIKATEFLKEKYKDHIDVTVQEEDGLGCATHHGIKKVNTTHMIFFPADLGLELNCLDKMIEAAQNAPDIIFKTSRWLEKGSFIEYNRFRFVLNRLAQTLLKVMFFTSLTDLTNPVQIIPTEYERRIKWKEKGFCALIEQSIVPVRLGYAVKEIPVKCFPRKEGESKNSWLQTMLYLKTAFRVRFTSNKKMTTYLS